jgi:hypothetical protein
MAYFKFSPEQADGGEKSFFAKTNQTHYSNNHHRFAVKLIQSTFCF